MRRLLALLLVPGLLVAEDAVHLKRGGVLRGDIVAETGTGIELRLASGSFTIPVESIERVERGTPSKAMRRDVREWWYLLLRGDEVRGWRSHVRVTTDEAVRIEERTVFFREGGGEALSLHRLEESGRDGAPREFLYRERRDEREELVSGRVAAGRIEAMVCLGPTREMRVLDLPEGALLPLPAVADFLENARPGESRTVSALDVKTLRTEPLLLRREEDDSAPGGDRPLRAAMVRQGRSASRALYAPGEGTVRLDWDGAAVAARLSTRERVEFARRAFAGPEPLGVEEALLYPFVPKREDPVRRHVLAGVALAAPDGTWASRRWERERGKVLEFERAASFATVEVFVEDLPKDADAGAGASLRRALARLNHAVESAGEPSPVRVARCGPFPACGVTLPARHRGEEILCSLFVVRAPDRAVVVAAAAPRGWWPLAERAFEGFVRSLEVIP